ncbi:MAG: helix-turn-helix domain-containing protein [Thermoplasmatales archaeon]|jgi:predicted DNA binding protein|nr:helix-turn-helix domain-containing protein [Thermoplasmatales archaeon]
MSAARLIEVDISVKRDNCMVTNVISRLKLSPNLVKLNIGVEESSHLLELGQNHKDVTAALRQEGVKVSALRRDKILALSASCDSCRILAKLNSVVLSARSQGKDTVIYRLLSDKNSLKRILKEFETEGIEFNVLEEIPYATLSGLTPRQSEIVLFALVNGYFDVKRKTSLTSIAKKFSIKPATADLIMRRALKKIVDAHMMGKV